METSRRIAVVVLMLASSGFAYAFGRQQGESEAREEISIRMEASLPFSRTDAADEDESGEAASGVSHAETVRSAAYARTAEALSSTRGVPPDEAGN